MTTVAELTELRLRRLDARMRARLGFAAGVGCATAMVAATLAARHGGPTGSPSIPPEPWRSWWWAGLIAAFLFYIVALVLLAPVRAGARLAIALAVFIQFLPLTAPRQLSGDIQTYAKQAWHPHTYQANPNGSVYGPLWMALVRAVNFIGGTTNTSIGHTEIILRLIAFGSVVGSVAIVAKLATRKAFAAATLGWNPLIAFHFAGGGHNDAFMVLLVLVALLAASTGAVRFAGAAWIASVFVKWASAPFYVLWMIARLRERKSAGIAGAIAATVVLVAMSFAVFGGSWLDVFWSLRHNEKIPADFGAVPWLHDLGISASAAVTISHALTVVVLLYFAIVAWRRRLHLGLATAVLTLVAARIEPWYGIWALSLAAADDDDNWGKVIAVALSGVMLTDAFTTVLDA